MRRIVVAGMVLLAVAAAFLAWNRGRDGAARAPSATVLGTPKPPAKAPEPAEPDEPAHDDGFVHGTVVIVEEDGRQLTGESGTLRAGILGQFPVTGGRWRAPMPAERRLELVDFLLGDRKAIPDPDTIEVPPDGVVEVRCRWFVPVRLRVVGENGNDLDDVELADRDGTSHPHWDRIVPDPELVHEAGRSPVTIQGHAGVRWFWVRARDHAWAQLVFWQGDGGERVVRLVRSGKLEARVVPYDPEAFEDLRLRRAGEDVLTWIPEEESGVCRIEGLPPGPLELRATHPGWPWWAERVAATANVEIVPGKTVEVTLSLHNTPPLARVDVEGTVLVDVGWGGAGAASILVHGGNDGVGGPVAEDGSWSLAWIPPGRHPFTVMPFGLTQVIDVHPDGTKDVRFAIPPPCEVEVRLVDAATGSAIPAGEDLYWHLKWEEADPRDIWESDEECAEPGVWRFRAAPGTLVVRFEADLHEGRAEVDLKPGKNRVDLKASPRFACDLALKDGKVPVPVFDGIRATALGGDGGIESCERDYPCRVRFTRAGRYRVTLPAIEGYEPVAPFEVEIAAGKIPRVEVPLRRSPR